ncbi:DinB family protein [Nitratireductor sp. CH_MIT9313-5]|uniref:DinB family protein n=1 Tax=Nitratireductor sp. CH_MIT9313-5 TaxID=3107764 RepID=UPI00300BD28E
MKHHFEMLAHYNRWANRVLCEAVETLDREEFSRNVGAYFKSMCGTLNHILIADRVWLVRFTGAQETSGPLNAIPYPDFADLTEAREREDARIIRYVQGLEDAQLGQAITYRTISSPTQISQPLAPALTHFFNHQTHHRGQAHMILSVLGKEPPPMDLIFYLRTPEGMALQSRFN